MQDLPIRKMFFFLTIIVIVVSLSFSMANPVLASFTQPGAKPPAVTLNAATNVTDKSAFLTWTPAEYSNFSRYEVRKTGVAQVVQNLAQSSSMGVRRGSASAEPRRATEKLAA